MYSRALLTHKMKRISAKIRSRLSLLKYRTSFETARCLRGLSAIHTGFPSPVYFYLNAKPFSSQSPGPVEIPFKKGTK